MPSQVGPPFQILVVRSLEPRHSKPSKFCSAWLSWRQGVGCFRSGEPTAHDAQFMPSASFAGPRPGKVFKRGPQGLGYYHDPNSAQKGAAAPAAPRQFEVRRREEEGPACALDAWASEAAALRAE